MSEYEPDLENIIINSKRWSEFNCMGAFAYKYEKEKYKFTNTDEWTYTEPLAIQLWSHSSRDGSETHQKEWVRTLETIIKSLGIELPQ